MSKSRWIIAIALGLIASLGHAQEGIDQPKVQPEASEAAAAEKPADDPPPVAPPVAAPANPTSEEHNSDTADGGNKQAYQYPDIIRGDGWAQWAMAFLAFVGVGISGWAVWLLKRTLDATVVAIGEGEKATAAAVAAATEAKKSNQIMRDELRPWVDISAVMSGGLELREDSQTISLPFEITLINKGKSPAFNLALDLKLQIIPDVGQRGFGGPDSESFNRSIMENAESRSKKNNFTVIVFNGEPHRIGPWLAHSTTPESADIGPDDYFGLAYCIAVAYGPHSKAGYGAILAGNLFSSQTNGLFPFTLNDIRSGRADVKAMLEQARLF